MSGFGDRSRPVGSNLLAVMRAAHAPKYKTAVRSTVCRMDACDRHTSEGKPFCAYHLLSHPYALAVRITLRLRGELGETGAEVDESPIPTARRRRRARVVTVR